MPRVKIKLPEKFQFKTELPLRISDINYGGHLGNDSVLTIAHEARLRCMKDVGFSELDCGGAGTIMIDSMIVYKNQGFYGDTIEVEVAVTDFSKLGCDFYYLLKSKNNGNEIARVKTGMVFYDYKEGKVVPVPEKFKQTFA
jgi:acyl-CoA thioesterase FadM